MDNNYVSSSPTDLLLGLIAIIDASVRVGSKEIAREKLKHMAGLVEHLRGKLDRPQDTQADKTDGACSRCGALERLLIQCRDIILRGKDKTDDEPIVYKINRMLNG